MEESNYNIYTDFAYVYDVFMDNIPYDEWHNYVHGLLMDYNINDGMVAELACGTGILAAMLASDGYDMIGVDISSDMLSIARDRCPEDVLLVNQDIRELDLSGTVAAMICICDGMNYMTDEESLYNVFQRVHLFLGEDGVFIFDMKTRYFYENVLGNSVIVDNREDASLIWENGFDSATGINEYLITIYNLAGKENDLFKRSEELHRQRAYPIEKVEELVQKAGMETVAVYNALTKEKPADDSERVYFIIRNGRQDWLNNV